MTELTRPTRTIVNVPDGMQPVVLARLLEERLKAAPDAAAALVFVARDGRRLQRMEDVLRAMLPTHPILTLPAWDCLPYDRVSPNGVTIAARMTTLSALTDAGTKGAQRADPEAATGRHGGGDELHRQVGAGGRQ